MAKPKPCPKVDAVIAKDAHSSYLYAQSIGRRFLEGEPTILKEAAASMADLNSSGMIIAFDYAQFVVQGRWPEFEAVILPMNSPHVACAYAEHVVKGRWVEGEPIIAKEVHTALHYAINVVKGRFLVGEATFLDSWGIAIKYAEYVIKGRWPEFERLLQVADHSTLYAAAMYAHRLKWRWHEIEERLAAKYEAGEIMYVELYLETFPEARQEWMALGWIPWL